MVRGPANPGLLEHFSGVVTSFIDLACVDELDRRLLPGATCLLALGLLVGDVLAWATVRPLESGIDLSIVGEGMEYFGAAAVLYPAFRWEDVVLANVIVLVLGFFASLSPAVRASRYEPVEAITKV